MKQFSAIAQTFILTSFSALSLFAISRVQAASFRGLGFLDSNNQYRTHLVSQKTANLRNKSRRKQRWILAVA